MSGGERDIRVMALHNYADIGSSQSIDTFVRKPPLSLGAGLRKSDIAAVQCRLLMTLLSESAASYRRVLLQFIRSAKEGP
jgi:hypothetical protein